MSRKPDVWKLNGWWRTNSLGTAKQKICEWTHPKSHAQKVLLQLLAAKDREQPIGKPVSSGDSPHLFSAIDEFLAYSKGETSEATCEFYTEKLGLLKKRLGDIELSAITLADGTAYKNYLMNEHPIKSGVRTGLTGMSSVGTNHHVRCAKILFNWCSKPSRLYLQRNPWVELKLLPERGAERILDDNEFKALLNNCTDGSVSGNAQDFREQLQVLRYTTMRPGELMKVRWEYIDWDRHQIVFPLEKIKTRKRRVITLLDQTETLLRERHRRLLRMGGGQGLVFPAPGYYQGKRTAGLGDEPILVNSLSQKFRRVVTRCVKKKLIQKVKQGERLRPYSSRHTRITELFLEGNELQVVMHEAGHSVTATTRRYEHISSNAITDTIRRRAGQSVVAPDKPPETRPNEQ